MFSGGLPHDIMHDVLEGIVPLELSLLLKHCILSENFLSLDEYYYRLKHFAYNYTETSCSGYLRPGCKKTCKISDICLF